MNLEELKAKLLKMKALAERGLGGEREVAERMIHELAAKYNLSLDAIGNLTERRFEIKFTEIWQRKLFGQLMGLMRVEKYGSRDADKLSLFYYKGSSKECFTECTEMEWLELTARYSVLCADYKRQLASFYTAFLMANDLLMPYNPNTPDMTPDEEKKWTDAVNLSRGITRSKLHKQLTAEGDEWN